MGPSLKKELGLQPCDNSLGDADGLRLTDWACPSEEMKRSKLLRQSPYYLKVIESRVIQEWQCCRQLSGTAQHQAQRALVSLAQGLQGALWGTPQLPQTDIFWLVLQRRRGQDKYSAVHQEASWFSVSLTMNFCILHVLFIIIQLRRKDEQDAIFSV